MSVSETVSKKSGRPKALSDETLAKVRRLFPDIKTKRGLQNQAYADRAVYLFYYSGIVDDDHYRFFLPPLADVLAGTKPLPMTLLSHLGRLDPQQAFDAAGVICAHEMSTKDAIAHTKQIRGVGRRSGSQFELLGILSKAIDKYTAERECTFQMVETTLESLSAIISEIHRDNGEDEQ